MNVSSTVGEGTTVIVAFPLDFVQLLSPANNVATLVPAQRPASQEQPQQVKKRAQA